MKHCTYFDIQYYDSQELTNMVSKLKQQVNYDWISWKKAIFVEATILNPRFKKYGFLNVTSFVEGKKSLNNQANNVNIENHTQSVTTNHSSVGKDSICNIFDEEAV